MRQFAGALRILVAGLLAPCVWAAPVEDSFGPPRQDAAADAPAAPAREFNSPEHQIIPIAERAERDRLIGNTPQLAIQQLNWPPAAELSNHLGLRDEEQALEAAAMAGNILRPDYLPSNLSEQWVPLRDWNVFYTDWVDHGGADTFLTNYTSSNVRIQIADAPNFVIIGLRPQTSRTANSPLEDWVLQVVQALFKEEVLPVDAGSGGELQVIESYEPSVIVEGEWVPRGPAERAAAPGTSASQDIERVKFFTDGEIVVVSVPKYLWDPSSLVNPFSERFPAPSGPAEIAAMTQMLFRPESPTPQPVAADPTSMNQLLEELLRATPHDTLLRDWGQRMQANLEQERLERMFDEMIPERRGLWHAQQLSERLLAEGVRALADQRYDEAATRFTHVLILDPLNVSAAMMLQITRDRAREWAVSVERPLPLPWFEAADQAMRRHENAVEERRLQSLERSQTHLALRDLRTQWLEAYAEHDLRQARQILHRMLDLDPGNASTLFFVDLIERLLAVEEGQATQ